MAIQSNFPAIRPSLLLDFANSKRLDPRITFTRASTARYYDGSTVAKAEENLLLRSQDYSAAWTVTSLTPVTSKTAPDGTSTATEFTASGANGTLTQSVTAIAADYTFSVWLRRVTGTGNIDISAHSGGTWVTQTISGTWARYTVTQTLTAGARTPGIRVVTSGDAIEVWGAQLEQRSAVTAYTATTAAPVTNYVPVLQTAAAGVPRFDHNPTTGESLGLLIEPAKTNSFTYSQEFDNAYWTKSNASILTAQNVAPDGTLTAQILDEGTTATVTHGLTRSMTMTINVNYSVSVYVKNITGQYLTIAFMRSSGGGTMRGYKFDLVNLTAPVLYSTGTNFNIASASIAAVGNGWYRIEMNVTMTGGVTTPLISIGMWDGVSSTFNSATGLYEYTGTGRQMYIWGAQFTTGAGADSELPTSYIATSGATATRQADAASMTGTNFSSWYDAAEGTLYGEFTPLALGAGAGVTINDGTTSNRIRVSMTSTTEQGSVAVAGSGQASLDGGTPAAGTTQRIAMAYKLNDFALSLAGGAVATDTSGLIPTVSQANIGASPTTVGTVQIRKFAFYPLRLTDAQLQAITG